MARGKCRNLITDLGKVLAQLSSVFVLLETPPPSPAHRNGTHTSSSALCTSQKVLWNSFQLAQSEDMLSFTPDTLLGYFLTCVLLPMNERGFPPPLARGEKGHFDGNSLPSFPLVLVCCCSPSEEK